MEDKGLECPHKSWTWLGLNDLPGWVAQTSRSDRPLVVLSAPWSGCLLLLPLLPLVPKNRLCHLLVLVVVVVVPLLWLWTALLPSSSLSKPGLLLAMNVSKETRTCFLVNSTPHLLAAPSTWPMPSSSPPALKIARSLSLSSKSLERPFDVVGRVDSNTAAFCGHWNTVIVWFLTSEVVFFFFGSSSIEVFSSFNCIADSSCLNLIWSMISCLPCSGNM